MRHFSVSPIRLLGILIAVQLVFIVTHWEKYNTGVLFLSWAYDASQYVGGFTQALHQATQSIQGLALFYLITFFVGHQFYQFYVFDGVSFANVFEFGFYGELEMTSSAKVTQWPSTIARCLACCVLSFIMSFYNMYYAYFIERTGKQVILA